MPVMVATESSTLRVTSVSSWLGEAPGRLIVTVTIGKATSGKRAIGSLWKPHRPATHSTKKIISAGSGRRIAQAEKFIAPRRVDAGWRRRPRARDRRRRGSRRRCTTTGWPAPQALEDLDPAAVGCAGAHAHALGDALRASTVNT